MLVKIATNECKSVWQALYSVRFTQFDVFNVFVVFYAVFMFVMLFLFDQKISLC